MLQLKAIKKDYPAGSGVVHALRGIDLAFRDSEFVSILGPSGCGKTTLLNLIGGLDQYTSGDLVIDGRSTKEYEDRDWDAYRNRSIGFVFQSYNLIAHQSVLANVELALTLTGVTKHERRRRAIAALEKVGLADQIHKAPSQLSGGQMQRVAIARALVNNPTILLADEPTGALDTENSIQIMELLQEVARDRLVVMVTHNPELAAQYSTRIIRLLDGAVTDDSDPYEITGEVVKAPRQKKPSLGFSTALGLSMNNLLTKKTRTFLTAFAGSIGIIGIALILAMSSGVQNYIDKVQEDTLSAYPLEIQEESLDMSALISGYMTESDDASALEHEEGYVYGSSVTLDLLSSVMSTDTRHNNLKDFKNWLELVRSRMGDALMAVKYSYEVPMNIYSIPEDGEDAVQLEPTTVFNGIYGEGTTSAEMAAKSMRAWDEIMAGENGETINSIILNQYDVLAGRWPEYWDEVVIIVDQNNEIGDFYLYSLGLQDPGEVDEIVEALKKGEEWEQEPACYSYNELLQLQFHLLTNSDLYTKNDDGTWSDQRENETAMKMLLDSAMTLKVVGIIRPNVDTASAAISGVIGYTTALTDQLMQHVQNSTVVLAQKADPSTDVLTGLPFTQQDDAAAQEENARRFDDYVAGLDEEGRADLYSALVKVPDANTESKMLEAAMEEYPSRADQQKLLLEMYKSQAGVDEDTIETYLSNMSDDEIRSTVESMLVEQIRTSYAMKVEAALTDVSQKERSESLTEQLEGMDTEAKAAAAEEYCPAVSSDGTYEENLELLGWVDPASPSSISLYASSFEDKEEIENFIDMYNGFVGEEDKIQYTDYVGLIMNSVSTIIDTISYVLIAFVGVSLVVSSIMIGIITYISVLERTREIGVLRAIGASKHDISSVFNAETLLIGLTSGLIGIIATELLCIPINAIIYGLTAVEGVKAVLPWQGAVVLILISMLLTLIAGLIPSRVASKKDPVVALRTE